MATRQIKDAKDITTNELIYFRGHAKATYMSDGTTVEDAINNAANSSDYYTKTEIDNKVSQKQDIISDLDTIRTNAANYKGTVTSAKIDGISKSSTSGIIDLGYINKRLITSTSNSMVLLPNIYYRNTNTSLAGLSITLGNASNSNIINEYFVEFTTNSTTGTTIYLPDTIKWLNGKAPVFEYGVTYQLSIINNLGIVQKFS